MKNVHSEVISDTYDTYIIIDNQLKNAIEDIDQKILNFKCELCVCVIIAIILSIGAFTLSLYNLTV